MSEVPPERGEERVRSRVKRGRKRPPAARHREEEPKSFWEFLKRTYATADPRSLGLLRIALGVLLIADLVRRIPDLDAHYSNAGWLSNHFMMYRPMSSHLFSLYLGFSTPGEVKVLCAFHVLVYLLFTLGLRTRLMHVLSALLLISINSRNIAVENGGWVVLTLLTIWTCFLPLGRRFSLDALLASLRARREGNEAALNDRSFPRPDTVPVVSFGMAALLLQWVTIYYLNVVHKTGIEWRNGTAVHYFFQQDRMVTAFGALIRDLIPLWGIKVMTYGALVTEASVTVLLISPFGTKYLRMVAWALVCMLHLSIDSVVQLGPFSYAMMTMFFALIPREFWEWTERRLQSRRPSAEVEFNPDSSFALATCGLLKRLDGLRRLHFVANPEVKALTVVAGGERHAGVSGLRAATSSLSLPILARAFLLLPGLGRVLKRGFAQSRLSTYLGWDVPTGSDERAPEPSPVRLRLRALGAYVREACVVLLMVACASQVLIENPAVPRWLRLQERPDWMTAMVIYPRMFQGWSMFAPSPPTDDGKIVVDGVTKDGRHFDPLTERAPDFELQPKAGFRMNQIWGDFHRRIHEDRFQPYWDGFRDFLRNHHELTGRPADELVAFDVYWVSEQVPPPGQPRGQPTRRKLFSMGGLAAGRGPFGPGASPPLPPRPGNLRQ